MVIDRDLMVLRVTAVLVNRNRYGLKDGDPQKLYTLYIFVDFLY